ncbi:MAG: hypothetical protein ACLUMK_09015 [Christensenellales bacterium]
MRAWIASSACGSMIRACPRALKGACACRRSWRMILRAYPYTQAQMLKSSKARADFEEEELETLRDDGTLDWRYVNGEVRFKNNALSGLRNAAEYAARATIPK